MVTDCGNVMLAALNSSLIHFLKFKYYATFTYITQIIHSDAHLNPLKGILSDTHNCENLKPAICGNLKF